MIFEVTRLKPRKKAQIRKSVAQIGSGILLLLSHAGLTATTDPAQFYNNLYFLLTLGLLPSRGTCSQEIIIPLRMDLKQGLSNT